MTEGLKPLAEYYSEIQAIQVIREKSDEDKDRLAELLITLNRKRKLKYDIISDATTIRSTSLRKYVQFYRDRYGKDAVERVNLDTEYKPLTAAEALANADPDQKVEESMRKRIQHEGIKRSSDLAWGRFQFETAVGVDLTEKFSVIMEQCKGHPEVFVALLEDAVISKQRLIPVLKERITDAAAHNSDLAKTLRLYESEMRLMDQENIYLNSKLKALTEYTRSLEAKVDGMEAFARNLERIIPDELIVLLNEKHLSNEPEEQELEA